MGCLGCVLLNNVVAKDVVDLYKIGGAVDSPRKWAPRFCSSLAAKLTEALQFKTNVVAALMPRDLKVLICRVCKGLIIRDYLGVLPDLVARS